MTTNPNNRNGWARRAVLVTIIVLLVGIGIAWGGQLNTVAGNKASIEKLQASQTKILDSLARIETKLEITPKPDDPEPKETGP